MQISFFEVMAKRAWLADSPSLCSPIPNMPTEFSIAGEQAQLEDGAPGRAREARDWVPRAARGYPRVKRPVCPVTPRAGLDAGCRMRVQWETSGHACPPPPTPHPTMACRLQAQHLLCDNHG